MSNAEADKHARAHVVMMAAGMPHDDVARSAVAKQLTAAHFERLAVPPEEDACRLRLIALLSDVLQ